MPDNIPDFTLKQNFPIASVIQAAQEHARLAQENQQQGNQSLVQGLQSIAQVGQTMVDKRLKVAQALALGRQFGIPDDQAKLMEPEQILGAAKVQKDNVDMAKLFALLHGTTPPAHPVATDGTSPTNPAQPASTPAQVPQNDAILTGGPEPTPAPIQPSIPVPIAAPPLKAPVVNKATGDLAYKILAANKPENVYSTSTDGKTITPVGQVPKGSHFVTPKDGTADRNEQDRLETAAANRITSIRGDASIARIEAQRDAATMAYNTIQGAKNEHRDITQTEYYDTLGQLWKARTGASPTDQSIKDLDINTIQSALHKKLTWVDGKPRGATTPQIVDALQKFIDDSGKQADKLHEGYMKPRLTKPYGLAEERWAPYAAEARGLSFADATKEARQAQSMSGLTPAEQEEFTRLHAKFGDK